MQKPKRDEITRKLEKISKYLPEKNVDAALHFVDYLRNMPGTNGIQWRSLRNLLCLSQVEMGVLLGYSLQPQGEHDSWRCSGLHRVERDGFARMPSVSVLEGLRIIERTLCRGDNDHNN